MNEAIFKRARPLVETDFENSGKVGEGMSIEQEDSFVGRIISPPSEVGTYGVVDRALEKKNRRVVALKEFKETKEGEGISQTAIREIALLRELQHPNIVYLRSVYVDPTKRSLRLVYDYAEYDLFEIVRCHRHQKKPLSESMVLSIMFQLVNGVHFLHSNWIVHRDLKPSNILVMGTVYNAANELGTVKIADFGLARSLLNPLRPLHTVVVTIWYRPPELLLGARNYSAAIDMWAVGAILGELLALIAMFQGEQKDKSNQFEEHQLRKIYDVLGSPDVNKWPDAEKLQYWPVASQWPRQAPRLDEFFANAGFDRAKPVYDLMLKCLDFNPDTRIKANNALHHEYFTCGGPPRRSIFDNDHPPYPTRRKKD